MGSAISKLKMYFMPWSKKCLIEIVWDPPWNPNMMSDEAKQKLGM